MVLTAVDSRCRIITQGQMKKQIKTGESTGQICGKAFPNWLWGNIPLNFTMACATPVLIHETVLLESGTQYRLDSMEADDRSHTWIACHECDLLHRAAALPARGKALCTRCNALLYRHVPKSLERTLALNLAALMLFIMVNCLPFLSLKIHGRFVENYFLSGAFQLYYLGMGEVGLLVFLTSFLFPLISVTGMLYILVPKRMGLVPWQMNRVLRLVNALRPWSLVSVFMLGVLISFVKLLDLAEVIPGLGLYAFIGLMVVLAASGASFDAACLWDRDGGADTAGAVRGSARQNRLVSCHTCALVAEQGRDFCPRCKSPLHSRKTNSMERTWALIIAAAVVFIPANVYPVMTVIQFGQGYPSTIMGGVVHLIDGGMWGLAMIIFFASIVVPVLKLIVLSYLLVSVKNRSDFRPKDRTLLFRVTEVVGAWSMVDIYVVAVLAGLVNLGALSTITPGIGVAFFGAVVVITMFAAASFDPRLIWDNLPPFTGQKGSNDTH